MKIVSLLFWTRALTKYTTILVRSSSALRTGTDFGPLRQAKVTHQMPVGLRLLIRVGKDVRNRTIAEPARPRFIDDPAKIVNRQIGLRPALPVAADKVAHIFARAGALAPLNLWLDPIFHRSGKEIVMVAIGYLLLPSSLKAD